MFIKECMGHELEKALPNTSEDYFNRSEVTYEDEGHERTLRVLYVRYFDGQTIEFTPFDEDPIFQVGSRTVYFRDIVAAVCLIKNPSLKNRKQIYISSQAEFSSYFKGFNYEKLKDIFRGLEEQKGFRLSNPEEYVG